jgi:hypothetical protein
MDRPSALGISAVPEDGKIHAPELADEKAAVLAEEGEAVLILFRRSFFAQGVVAVLGGRQPAFVLCLALHNKSSPIRLKLSMEYQYNTRMAVLYSPRSAPAAPRFRKAGFT